ncbi:DUF4309 domain-containing protein [Bacillus sp. Bva_UNVM-123]|uniref:polysaccharide deacetylase family protein n=1 Tax=Bacillus sp. Bva_UNVM-123 TaxID=2829798 RepID=UPI00391EFE62
MMKRRLPLLSILAFVIFLSACNEGKTLTNEKPQTEKNEPQLEEVSDSNTELNELYDNAKLGKISESPFNVDTTNIETVKQKWGEPNKVDEAGYGYYANYASKKVTIGFNGDGEIFDLRSYAVDLQEISVQMVEDAFGTPTQIRNSNQERIYVYKLDSGDELKIIIENKTNAIDHISVFNPQRTVATSQKNKQDYLLDIKGNSNKLTENAWKSMQDWRKQITLFAEKQENVYTNGPNIRKVALTFDDGPDEMVTQGIIDILNKYDVKGNFFFLGSKMKDYPQVVHNAYESGHLVLSHTYHHLDLTTLANNNVKTEITQTGKEIRSIIGKEPAILRTPYGATNEQIAKIAQQEGYSIVLWSIDTLDWSQMEAENIVYNVTNNLRNGDIILMHSNEDKSETEKALPRIIEALQERNYEIVTLEELLEVKAYQ